MNANVLLGLAKLLPSVDPLLKDFAHVTVRQWDLFDAVNPQGRAMKHLFDSSRCRLENGEGYKLLQLDWLLLIVLQ